MLQPSLTVIAGGNPDDQFSQSQPQHLTLIHLPPTPVDATASNSQPVIIIVIEYVIATLVRWKYSLEMYLVWLRRRATVLDTKSAEPMIGGRGGW